MVGRILFDVAVLLFSVATILYTVCYTRMCIKNKEWQKSGMWIFLGFLIPCVLCAVVFVLGAIVDLWQILTRI